ncbi:MAG TPA: SDR family oxidoreductase [Saprospiraceae bacterium]|nr:SDR family oxidoreductase [Saprospiraceae bacterium]
MSTSTNLQSKTALITGGSKGIGLGIAEAMARQHMKVAITSRHFDEAQAAAKHLISLGAESALAIECDVRDYDAQQNAVREVLADWGQLDVVIANAGVGYFAPIDKMSQEQWHEIIDINLTGAFYTLQASVEALKASKGYLITLASLAGTNFFANGAAYNASKFGLVGFTQAAMLDLRPYGIKVSTIMPGSVATHFNGHVPDEKDGWKIQPEDIGQIVIDLLKMNPRTLPSKIEVRPSLPG